MAKTRQYRPGRVALKGWSEPDADLPPGFGPYRVQMRTRYRLDFPFMVPRRWWNRTWQCEWDGASRAYRAYTRNGAILKALRAWRSSTGVAS